MQDALAGRLRDLCTLAGRVPWWTQAAGSNVSVKGANELLIKASGRRLDEVRDRGAMASLAWPAVGRALRALSREPQSDAAADAAYRVALSAHLAAGSPPPSMETGLHALIDCREVLHLHALSAVALAHLSQHEPREVSRLFAAQSLSWRFVPATVPGWSLAAAVADGPAVDAWLLGNHGLVLAGDDVADKLRAYREVERAWAAEHPRRATIADVAAADAMQRPWLGGTAPLEPTLPDVAVFRADIEAITEPVANADGAGRRLRPPATSHARGPRELWAAHLALHEWLPTLSPLSAAYVDRVADLPQERWRRAQAAAGSQGEPRG
jgi:hypothetical protein